MPATAQVDSPAVRIRDRQRLLTRLARVEGQLRGVQRMIREGDPCERVAQQLAAARGGLKSAFGDLVACTLETKLEDLDADPATLRGRIDELAELLKKYA